MDRRVGIDPVFLLILLLQLLYPVCPWIPGQLAELAGDGAPRSPNSDSEHRALGHTVERGIVASVLVLDAFDFACWMGSLRGCFEFYFLTQD